MLSAFAGVVADARRTAASPAPQFGENPDAYLRFVAASLLSAMLTWRFAALLAVVVALAWWIDR